MLVKKKNPEWKPSENPELQVGETIDMTNPKALIINGDVVAIDSDGSEMSAYELYGVITGNEKQEFEAWVAVRKQETLKKSLAQEEAKLKEELKVADKQTSTEPAAAQPTKEPVLAWHDLVKKAQEKGVYKIGLKRVELEKLIA